MEGMIDPARMSEARARLDALGALCAVLTPFTHDKRRLIVRAAFDMLDTGIEAQAPAQPVETSEHIVLIFAETMFEALTHFDGTQSEAHAFCRGISAGASKYGAGGCSAYVWPNDSEEMHAREEPSAIAFAMSRMKQEGVEHG